MHTRVKRFVRGLVGVIFCMTWMLAVLYARNNDLDYLFLGLVMVVPLLTGFIVGEIDDKDNHSDSSGNQKK